MPGIIPGCIHRIVTVYRIWGRVRHSPAGVFFWRIQDATKSIFIRCILAAYSTTNYLYKYIFPKIITMLHEHDPPEKATIRQFSTREEECIFRIFTLQVVLVCMAQAARKAWRYRHGAGEEPEGEGGASSTLPGPYLAGSEPVNSVVRHLFSIVGRYCQPGRQAWSRAGRDFSPDR